MVEVFINHMTVMTYFLVRIVMPNPVFWDGLILETEDIRKNVVFWWITYQSVYNLITIYVNFYRRMNFNIKRIWTIYTLIFPASLMASTNLSCNKILWLLKCTPDIVHITTSTCLTASTRLRWSENEASTSRAPCSLNDNNICSLSMSRPISGRCKTYVVCPWAKLAFTILLPI